MIWRHIYRYLGYIYVYKYIRTKLDTCMYRMWNNVFIILEDKTYIYIYILETHKYISAIYILFVKCVMLQHYKGENKSHAYIHYDVVAYVVKLILQYIYISGSYRKRILYTYFVRTVDMSKTFHIWEKVKERQLTFAFFFKRCQNSSRLTWELMASMKMQC